MPNVLIRDLPDDVHSNLQRRAEEAGQSLQQYLSAELSRVATSPTLHDVLARIAQRSGGNVGFDNAVRDLANDRPHQ
jgi:plasmid stability protein